MIVVVKKNDVQIGRIAELFAAEFAVADDGELVLFPMASLQALPAGFEHFFQDQIGQMAQVVAQNLETQ